MGTKGPAEQGHAIFVYDSPQIHPNLGLYFGDSLAGLVRTTTKQAMVTELGLGEPIVGSTMLEILLELLNQHADGSGQIRWKPIRGGNGRFTFSVGGFGQVINERFNESHPFWTPTLAIWQADYRRNRADVDAGLLSLDSLRGFTGASMRKYRVEADVLLPPEYLTDGWRSPRSTVSDNFNRANEDPITGWDEVAGAEWTIVDEEIASGDHSLSEAASARFQTAVDSDDHETEVTFSTDTSDFAYISALVRFAAAAETYYYGLIRAQSTLREIGKFVTGTQTVIKADNSGGGPPQLVRLRIDSADVLQLFDDDVSALSQASETSITGNLRGGVSGLGSGSSTGDNWSLTDLAVGVGIRNPFGGPMVLRNPLGA